MLVILLQKGRGGGLSGAFGGTGGHSAFGAKTGDVFTWITVGLAAGFVVIACVGNFVFVPPSNASEQPPIQALPLSEAEQGDADKSPAALPAEASQGQPAQSESAAPSAEGE